MLINPSNSVFRPLPVGAIVSGCEILSHLNTGDSNRTQYYKIKFLCCGTTKRITHKRLVQRHSCGYEKCNVCGPRHVTSKPVPFPKEVRKKALELRAQGLSYKKIGDAVGASQWTVRSWCDEAAEEKAVKVWG